jgi:hypothetical protein
MSMHRALNFCWESSKRRLVYVDEGSGSENLTVKSSNDILLRCKIES